MEQTRIIRPPSHRSMIQPRDWPIFPSSQPPYYPPHQFMIQPRDWPIFASSQPPPYCPSHRFVIQPRHSPIFIIILNHCDSIGLHQDQPAQTGNRRRCDSSAPGINTFKSATKFFLPSSNSRSRFALFLLLKLTLQPISSATQAPASSHLFFQPNTRPSCPECLETCLPSLLPPFLA